MFFRTARFFHNSLWNSRFVDLFYEKTTFKIVPSCETPYIDAERGPWENCYVHLYSSILALAICISVLCTQSWGSNPLLFIRQSKGLGFILCGLSYPHVTCEEIKEVHIHILCVIYMKKAGIKAIVKRTTAIPNW